MRDRNKETDKQTERQGLTDSNKETDKQTERQGLTDRNKETDKQTERQGLTDSNKETDRQIETDRKRKNKDKSRERWVKEGCDSVRLNGHTGAKETQPMQD